MAVIQTNLTCELQEPVKVRYLDGNLFSQDNQGNQINVAVLDGGEPAEISGTVSANVIRADGGTVAVTGGTITDNVASIVLPSAAYAVPGLVSIVVKLTTSGVVTSIAAVVANVYKSSTDTAVDPGTIIPSITALISAIDTAVASIPADYSSLWISLAPAFNSSSNYVAGQYVTYNGGVYRFNTTHSGSWAASDVSAVNIGGELASLKSATNDLSIIPGDSIVSSSQFTEVNNNSITYTVDAETGAITITNGSTSTYACLQTVNTWGPNNLIPGRTYRLHCKATKVSGSPNMRIGIRGISGNADGMAKSIVFGATDGESFIDFVATEYMVRVSIFVAFGSSTKNSVSTFSDIWVKEYDTTGIDNNARSVIKPFDLTQVTYETGSIDNTTGEKVTSSKKIMSNYIRVNAGDIVTSQNYFRVHYYSAWATSSYNAEKSKTEFSKDPFTVTDKGMIKVVLRNETDTELTSVEKENLRLNTYVIHPYKANEINDVKCVRTLVFDDEEFGKDWLAYVSWSGASLYKEGTKFRLKATSGAAFYALNADSLYWTKYADGIDSLSASAYTINTFKSDCRYRISCRTHGGTDFGNTTASLRVYSDDGTAVALLSLTPLYTDNTQVLSSTFPGDSSKKYAIVLYLPNSSFNNEFEYSIEEITYEYNINTYVRDCQKLKKDVENGGFSSANGKQSDNTRLRLKSPFFMGKGSRLRFSIGSLYWHIWELSSNATTGGNVLYTNDWTNGETTDDYIVKNDCYMMFGFRNSSNTSISMSDFDPSYYIRVIEGGSGGANELFADYFMVSDSTVNAKVREYGALLKTGTDIESFLFFTDPHIIGYGGITSRSWKDTFAKAIDVMGGVYNMSPVDFCINGGDGLTGESPYNAQFTAEQALYGLAWQDQICRKTFGADRYLPMVGNHDYNYQASDLLTEDNMVNAMFRKEGKAYYSYKGNHTMLYILNTGLNRKDGGTGGYDVPMDSYKWEQIDWLANKLIEDDDDHSVICLHIILNNNSGLPEFSLFTNANTLCAAYNSHTSVTLNETTYDFSGCTGHVEFFLGGHLHGDGHNFIKNDIPCIMRSNTTNGNVIPTFDLVLCDWNNNKVYFKKFGNGQDLTVDLEENEFTVGDGTT